MPVTNKRVGGVTLANVHPFVLRALSSPFSSVKGQRSSLLIALLLGSPMNLSNSGQSENANLRKAKETENGREYEPVRSQGPACESTRLILV